jgi:hypothetical protein
LLVARPRTNLRAGAPRESRRPVLLAIARRSLPHVVEATLFPAFLFWVFAITVNARTAMIAVLVWTYGAVARRRIQQRPLPAILVLATLALTVRTTIGLASGSTFAYFIQPVATTGVLAVVFLTSVVLGRPLVSRLAHDFCPLAPDVAARPGVARLFAGLTILWSVVHILTAATTLSLLVSLPVGLFLPLKTIACLTITAVGIVITVSWSVAVANREDLVFAHAAV